MTDAMTSDQLNAAALLQLRKSFGVTQAEYAQWMGVPFRTYQDLESGKSPIRAIHIRAAQMAALYLARERIAGATLSHDLKELVRELSLTVG